MSEYIQLKTRRPEYGDLLLFHDSNRSAYPELGLCLEFAPNPVNHHNEALYLVYPLGTGWLLAGQTFSPSLRVCGQGILAVLPRKIYGPFSVGQSATAGDYIFSFASTL